MRKNFTLCSALLVAGFLGTGVAQAQTYNNGNFSTGATTLSGVAAPANSTWSEVSNDTGVTTDGNANAGFSANKAAGASLADDFTVPAGQRWSINSFSFYPYLSGYTGTTSPFTELYVRVWRGAPNVATSTVVYGDLTTNRILATASTSTATYRIFNTQTGTTAPGTTRLIWKIQAPISPALVLTPGTYWVEWSSVSNSTTLSHFYVPVTIAGMKQVPKANALQYTTAWAPVVDAGLSTTANTTIDFPFQIAYSVLTATAPAAATGPALRVSPVPTSDNVQVEFTELRGASTLELTDMQGRRVWSGSVAAHSASTSVPMANLASGIYTLSISSAEGLNHLRVVKN